MFKKSCPWCNQSISVRQLGRRPYKTKPKWYGITREQQVCPYCAGAVKLAGKSLRFVGLAAPLLVVNFLQIFMGKDVINANTYNPYLLILAIIGILIAFFLSRFDKDEKT